MYETIFEMNVKHDQFITYTFYWYKESDKQKLWVNLYLNLSFFNVVHQILEPQFSSLEMGLSSVSCEVI